MNEGFSKIPPPKSTLNLIKPQIYLPIYRKFSREKHIKHHHRVAVNKIQNGVILRNSTASTNKLKETEEKETKIFKRHTNQIKYLDPILPCTNQLQKLL